MWWGTAELVFAYGGANYVPQGRLAQCAGLVQAASQAAHAVLAARGEWVSNEKALLTGAGLQEVDQIVTAMRPRTRRTTARGRSDLRPVRGYRPRSDRGLKLSGGARKPSSCGDGAL